jgi:hypothetical protein
MLYHVSSAQTAAWERREEEVLFEQWRRKIREN